MFYGKEFLNKTVYRNMLFLCDNIEPQNIILE